MMKYSMYLCACVGRWALLRSSQVPLMSRGAEIRGDSNLMVKQKGLNEQYIKLKGKSSGTT